MHITCIDIKNFRKLKKVRIDFSKDKTIFVGANNSGKTSAMDALIAFLKTKKVDTKDFTICNWFEINKIGDEWVKEQYLDKDEKMDLDTKMFHNYTPTFDIWLSVNEKELHYVSRIIPTLDWDGSDLGLRLIFEPKDIEVFYREFVKVIHNNKTLKNADKLKLWPLDLREFLDRNINSIFSLKSYILNPSKKNEFQDLTDNSEPLEFDPIKGLFKVDIINAQRGFSDNNSLDISTDNKLSKQLISYFKNHLDPSNNPQESDIKALEAIDDANKIFNSKLEESFKASIGELEGLNYPGFSDPKIKIACKVEPTSGLEHEAAVNFSVLNNDDSLSFCLPEKYNGLGYQNLISMVFNLISFRDSWMRLGKKNSSAENELDFIEPVHLVLIEEPEAHLHSQAQQVFIKKVYEVLRNHDLLKNSDDFTTQLIISTHSSYIAHELDFSNLRYFKRKPAEKLKQAPQSEVLNMTNVFGKDTDKFITRYLKTTHCDLFFADAAIIVEGSVEKMLVPFFIKDKYPTLDRAYISLLEISGSHAHKLKNLIETLGFYTLIITDLDSCQKIEKTKNKGRKYTTYPKVSPEKGKKYLTRNTTIKTWIPEIEELDKLMEIKDENKIKNNVRVAFQHEIKIKINENEQNVIPYTFEDSLMYSNLDTFKGLKDMRGLLKSLIKIIIENDSDIEKMSEKMFEKLDGTNQKAEMALDLLYETDPENLVPPEYIKEGLDWLQRELENNQTDFTINSEKTGETNE